MDKRAALVASATRGDGVTAQQTLGIGEAIRAAEAAVGIYGEALASAEQDAAKAAGAPLAVLRRELRRRANVAAEEHAKAEAAFVAARTAWQCMAERSHLAHGAVSVPDHSLESMFAVEIEATTL